MSVTIDLSAMYAAVGDLAEVGKTLRGVVAMKAMGDYIKTTPRDTGRAQAGWDVTEGDSGGSYLPPEGAAREDPSKALTVSSAAPPFGAVTIYNNVHYVPFLDEGSSKQAPAGMTAIVEANVNAFLRQEFGG